MMDQRKRLRHFVQKAKRSLNFEYMMPKLQFGILIGLSMSTAILIVSRLFVFPYYDEVAIAVGVGALIAAIFYIWWKHVREKDALHRLDTFYPHNELMTALSFDDEANPLVKLLLQKAQKESPAAFERFKKREKVLWKAKVLIGIVLMVIALGVLSIFPSATQQEAQVVEKEQDVIEKLEKEVAKIEKKAKSEEVKKQLQELSNKLKDMETSEEALREVVKKQKELKLQEQKLKEKETSVEQGESEASDGLTEEEQAQLKELMELQNELASTANSTQSALSKLGKPISFELQNAIASELGSASKGTASNSGSSSNNQSSNQNGSQQQGNGQNSNQQGQNGQGQGKNGSGQGKGQGQGNGQGGQGNGQGNGAGQGNGTGIGAGGAGAGLGQGSRDLLSIPERIGERNETTVDGGPLNEGEPVGEQKGSVPVTKGTIRPYEEVIGQYKESYLKSSERIQLPKDLQDIVQSYFSSIESNE
jgi:hypothetical protein